MKRFGELHNEVWFADLPTFGKFRQWRQVCGIAFFGASVNPRHDGSDLLVGEVLGIAEESNFWVGAPWRHLAGDDALFDGLHPGPRVFVTEQREWPDLTGAMAICAVLEENRRDIPGKRDFSGWGLLSSHGECQTKNHACTA